MAYIQRGMVVGGTNRREQSATVSQEGALGEKLRDSVSTSRSETETLGAWSRSQSWPRQNHPTNVFLAYSISLISPIIFRISTQTLTISIRVNQNSLNLAGQVASVQFHIIILRFRHVHCSIFEVLNDRINPRFGLGPRPRLSGSRLGLGI